jgi:hypothetical protein
MGIIGIGHNDITVSPNVVGNPCGIGLSGISLSGISTTDVLHLRDIG